MTTVDDLPDILLGNIMSFADFGGARGWNARRPAARYALVCRRWRDVYHRASTDRGTFVANDKLSRLENWSVATKEGNNVPIANVHGLWWSGYNAFQGGEWIDGADNGAGGPFRLRRRVRAPTLFVTFRETVQLRAVLFSARNRPRRVVLEKARAEGVTIDVPPPSMMKEGIAFWSDKDLPEYDAAVKRMLPRGNPARESDHRAWELPVVIPGRPFIVEEGETLSIKIIQSHERGWVAINILMFYGAVLSEPRANLPRVGVWRKISGTAQRAGNLLGRSQAGS